MIATDAASGLPIGIAVAVREVGRQIVDSINERATLPTMTPDEVQALARDAVNDATVGVLDRIQDVGFDVAWAGWRDAREVIL